MWPQKWFVGYFSYLILPLKQFLLVFWLKRWHTPSNSEIICGQNVGTKVVCGIIFFFEKKDMLKIWKKMWVPFGSYLLNNTANPAHFHSNWAGLAVLFSRKIPNGTQFFFQIFRIYIFDYFIKNPQTTIVLTFLTHIISAIGGVG